MTSQQLTVGNVVYGAGGAFNKCLGRTNQGESLKASGRRRQGEQWLFLEAQLEEGWN